MNYYRKPINKTVDDVKLKMQIGALTLKLSENNNKIDNLLNVDKSIKKDVSDNLNLINSNKENISKNDDKIYKKGLLITSNNSTIHDHKNRLDVIEEDIKTISSNSTEIIDTKNNLFNIENAIKNHNTNIIKIPDIENDIVTLNSNIRDITKNNTTNIINNYNITQINKKNQNLMQN